MGSDRASSVVDPFNEVWDAPRVFVADGSCFASGGCQNPTLTMAAIALRACDRILDRFRRGAL
jgi:choline dehydrogenase-like flavoprotein